MRRSAASDRGDVGPPAAGPRLVDRISVAAFLALWLLPLAYRIALQREPPLPRPLPTLTAITCLFAKATPNWNAFYVEVRTRQGGPWHELDTSADFELRPFGNRDRLHRFLVQWPADAHDARAELAQWLHARHQARSPDAAPWLELRFIGAAIAVRGDRPPEGAWVDPPLVQVPLNHRRVLSTHRLAPEVP